MNDDVDEGIRVPFITSKDKLRNRERKKRRDSRRHRRQEYHGFRESSGAEIFSSEPTSWNESFGVTPPGLHLSEDRPGYIEYDERMRSSGYFSERKNPRLSDRWTSSSTKFMEDTFNAASGGVILILVLALVFYVFVSFIWTMIFEIESVKESVVSRDFSAAFAPLGFIIALITRDWIDGSGKKIVQPLRSLHKYLFTMKSLDKVLYSVYRSKILELHKLMTSEDRIVDLRDLWFWIRAVHDSIGTNTTLLQGLALHSVRIFKKVDKKIDFEIYGITKEEISYFENHLPIRNGKSPGIQNALNISYMILSRLYSSIFAISSGTTESMPKMDSTQRQALNEKLDDLSNSLYEIEQSKDIWEPTLFRYSYASILFVFLGFLLQVDIYSNVDIYMLLVAPLVTILYTLPLIFAYYVGSPFDEYPRWLGPDFDQWRDDTYQILKHNETRLSIFLKKTLELTEKHSVRLILSKLVDKGNHEKMKSFISQYHKNIIPHGKAKQILKSIMFGSNRYKIIDSKINDEGISEIIVLEIDDINGVSDKDKRIKESLSFMGEIKTMSTLSKISSYINTNKKMETDDDINDKKKNKKNNMTSSDFILNEIQKGIDNYNSNAMDDLSSSPSSSSSSSDKIFVSYYRDLVILPEDASFLSIGIIDVRDLKLKRN